MSKESEEKRTLHEIAIAVSHAISEINRVVNAVPIMTGYNFFLREKFYNNGVDKLISDTCIKYNVSESHIRQVAGWNKKSGL
jgi:hypothetical protein